MATQRRKREKRTRVSAAAMVEKNQGGYVGTSVRLPKGVSFFSPSKAGAVNIDIIPYMVPKDAGNPVANGTMYCERTFYVHKGIGSDGRGTYICPLKTTNRPCPICEHRSKLAANPDTEDMLLDALKPKKRQLWNVFAHDDPEKGVQVWDVSFYLFGEQLVEELNNADEDDDFVFFSDPEDGSTLRVGFKENSFKGHSYYEAKSINFKARKKPLSDEIVDAANILDELLIVESYEKLKAIFFQIDIPSDGDEDEDEDEPEDTPKPKAKSKGVTGPKPPTAEQFGIEKGSDVDHDEFGACSVIKISPDGTSLTLVDEEEEIHRAVAPDEVTLVVDEPEDDELEDDEPEEALKPKAKPKSKAKAKAPAKKAKKPVAEPESESEDDDDWDNNWDEEEDE